MDGYLKGFGAFGIGLAFAAMWAFPPIAIGAFIGWIWINESLSSSDDDDIEI